MFHVIVSQKSVRYFATREAASAYASRMMRQHGAANVVYNFTRVPGWKATNGDHFVPKNDADLVIPAHARMGVAL